MKILLTQFVLSSAFWCQTFEFEYFNGNIASCVECDVDLECSSGRQCWADAWCKTDVLCGDEDDNECSAVPDCDSGCPNDERCACYANMSDCATTGYWHHCGCGLGDQPCCGGCSPCGLTVQAVCSSQLSSPPPPPPPLPSPPPPMLIPLHQYLSPYPPPPPPSPYHAPPPPSPYHAPPPPSPYPAPPPPPSPPSPYHAPPPLPLQSSDDMVLKYFKEIGLPLIIAMIGLIGSIMGRSAVKHRTKSKRRKRAQIQLQNMQNALDDDNLSDEASDSTEKV